MALEEVKEFILEKAEIFGGEENFIKRDNTGDAALNDDGAFFGIIRPEEEAKGIYHDFSIVLFPGEKKKNWVIALGVGSGGFKNDYELSTYPGVRRLFQKLVDSNGNCKTDFSDIESTITSWISNREELQHIKKTLKKYTKFLPACEIIFDPSSTKAKDKIAAFVAAYAKMRDWPTNKIHRKNVAEALNPFLKQKQNDDEQSVMQLLKNRKYLVLEGPPGTGKTRLAHKIAKSLDAETFFTQFHAETSYADFIYGIRPDVESEALKYKAKKGIFSKAIKSAEKEKTVLIIDEINRANLSQVLGPIFYLFEPRRENTAAKIEIHPELELDKIPDNLYVIATMNTADRSLAVIDFALRRRFAWYPLYPRVISDELEGESCFFEEDFLEFEQIFNWHASSDELLLQPGQAYFIADSNDEMIQRIEYELFPLMKEYLRESFMISAKEDLNTYFSQRISKSLEN